jgi:hypothetical protein
MDCRIKSGNDDVSGRLRAASPAAGEERKSAFRDISQQMRAVFSPEMVAPKRTLV